MISLEDVKKARERIKDWIHETPLFSSATFSLWSGNEVYLKAENLQKSGAFKFRGAMNFMLSMDEEERKKGVVTGSSGNHGQALACAAKILGVKAIVVVPEDASTAKVAAIEGYGALVERCGRSSTERISRAMEIAEQREMTFVPPFDHPWIMAGQGTTGLEILDELPDVDAVLVPCGGCGLISGVATALKESSKKVKVYGVEPERSNSTYLSLKAGHIVELKNIETIADGLRTASPGKITFPIVQKYVDDVLLVSEEEIKKTVLLLLERAKLLVEPSGAVPVAALLYGKVPFKAKKTVALMSGGNVDLLALSKWIEESKA